MNEGRADMTLDDRTIAQSVTTILYALQIQPQILLCTIILYTVIFVPLKSLLEATRANYSMYKYVLFELK